MRSVVLLQFDWEGLGGAENSACCFAEALEAFGDVELLAGPHLNSEVARERFGVELRRTRFLGNWPGRDSGEPVGKLQRMRRWLRKKKLLGKVSAGADVFVVLTHSPPPLAEGRFNILHVLFPSVHPDGYVGGASVGRGLGHALRSAAAAGVSAYARRDLKERLNSYDVLTANSTFTADWSRRRWEGERAWDVLYPPVTMAGCGEPTGNSQSGRRSRQIVTAGRIGVKKQPREMVEWLASLAAETEVGVRLVAVGAVVRGDEGHAEWLRAQGGRVPLSVEADVSVERLHELYASSRVYWHPVGFGKRDDEPAEFEHFGMTTVEAMSAGCVPVVYGRGGQVEIVEHGVSGFVWERESELIEHTKRLLEDDGLWERMSSAARERAKRFSRGVFRQAVRDMVVGRLGAGVAGDVVGGGGGVEGEEVPAGAARPVAS